jgi:hypothetical protein
MRPAHGNDLLLLDQAVSVARYAMERSSFPAPGDQT